MPDLTPPVCGEAPFPRSAMTEHAHGTRSCYQRDACRCVPCRAANAAYQQALRRLEAAGKAPLGRLIDKAVVLKMVKGMRIEGFTFVEIATRLGLTCQQFRLHGDQVTIGKYLQLRRLYRATMDDPPNV